MKNFIPSAVAAEILSQLSVWRLHYVAGVAASQRVEAATALADLYRRVGLTDRAADWLLAVTPLPEEDLSGSALQRFCLTSAAVWLDREDTEAATRVLAKLRNAELSLDDERAFLAATVRLSLLTQPSESFAPLERAFRHLRHHPSPLWSARFLLWRVHWLEVQGREDEVAATLKKALAEATVSDDPEVRLQAWFAVAEAPRMGKTKALRAAQQAFEAAEAWDIPRAAAEAQRVISRLTAPKESESTRAFRAFVEGDQAQARQNRVWDRQSREEDSKVFEAAGQDRRRHDSALLASIAGRLAGDASLSRSLDDLYQPLRSLMAADVFGIALWIPEQKVLDYALFIEEGRRTRVGLIPVDSTRSLGAWCFRSQKAVRVNDIDREYTTYLKELSRLADHRPKSMLFQPLSADGLPLGIITVQSFARGAYGPEAESQLAVIAACVSLHLRAAPRGTGTRPEVPHGDEPGADLH